MKKVAIFLKDGFEEIEALTAVDCLRRVGVAVDMMADKSGDVVQGAHGIRVIAEGGIGEVSVEKYDGIILPGGMPGAASLEADAHVTACVREFAEAGKLVAAICAAPMVLGTAGVLNGKKAVCYPGFEQKLKGATVVSDGVVQDGNIITAKGMGVALEFALRLVRYLMGEEQEKELASSLMKEA